MNGGVAVKLNREQLTRSFLLNSLNLGPTAPAATRIVIRETTVAQVNFGQ